MSKKNWQVIIIHKTKVWTNRGWVDW